MNVKSILSNIFTDRNPDFKFDQRVLIKARDYINDQGISNSIVNSDYRDEWKRFFLDFISLIKSDDINRFLRSKVVLDTMFYEAPSAEFFKIISKWNFFKKALVKNQVGCPPAYGLYPNTNGNTIHHLYSVSQIVNSEVDLSDYDQIIEFGGGYGNMAWCIERLGFKGDYYIYDSSIMYILQKLFLESSEVRGIKFIENIDDIRSISRQSGKKTLIIATWSISETPLEIRDVLFENPDNSLLIAFQKNFGNINNLDYFTRVKRNYLGANIYEIKHLPDNHYMIKK